MLIPSLNFGGAQRVFHQHATALSRHHAVTECVFNRDLGVAFPSGLPLESLDVPAGQTTAGKALRFAERVVRLRALKRRLQPDVTISHLEGADHVNVLSTMGDRTILCIHGTKVGDANISGRLGAVRKRLLIPQLYRRAAHVVTVSRAIREELMSHFGLPASMVTAIPNGFEVDFLREQARAPLSPEVAEYFARFPTVVTSGRMAVQKNQAELVEVFARLRRRNREARLVLVGDGELRGQLLTRCAALGLATSEVDRGMAPGDADVLFLGYQSNPFSAVARSTVFVLTSGWEGFPMALGEAMACGAPCVTVDCPTGPRELLSPGDAMPRRLDAPERTPFGVLMPLLDGSDAPREAWTRELDAVLADSHARQAWSAASLERIREFDLEVSLSRWRAVVEGT